MPHDLDIDIHAPAFARDPFPTYADLRTACPVYSSQRYGGFHLLTRYADVRAAALDWRAFTSAVVGVTAIPVITHRTKPQLPIELDPPLHSTYRALVNPTFSPARLGLLRPAVEALAGRLFTSLIGRGDVEFVGDYAIPLSIGTLGIFTGLPTEDSALWLAWVTRMFNPRDPDAARQATSEFGAYIDDLIARRAAAPGEDFISMLLGAEIDGRRLDRDEVHSFVTVMFGAGFETTSDALSTALFWLSEAESNFEALRSCPALIPTAVEEFLRFDAPIQIFGRNATGTMSLHGSEVGAGEVVALGFGAANRDPDAFPRPEECLLDRTPNRHLAFGAGPHLCLGAPVARLELAITLGLLCGAARVERSGEPPIWKERGDRRGLARLPLTIVAADGVSAV